MLFKSATQVIPTQFMQEYGDRVDATVTLEGPSGQVWEVGLGDVHVGIKCFRAGWRAFSDDHYLEVGDVLVFKLIDYSYFTVQIFDTTGCEKHKAYAARNIKDLEEYEITNACKKRNYRDALKLTAYRDQRVKRIEIVDEDFTIMNADFKSHTNNKDDQSNGDEQNNVNSTTACNDHKFSIANAGLDQNGNGRNTQEFFPSQVDQISTQNQSAGHSVGSAECPIVLDGRERQSNSSKQSYYNYCHKKLISKREKLRLKENKNVGRREGIKGLQRRKYVRRRKSDLIQVLTAQNLRKLQDKLHSDTMTEKCPVREAAREKAHAKALSYRTNNPSVVNVMKISNVYYGFFLYVNKDFAARWLPKGLTTVNLVDSDGYSWKVRWLGVDHRGFPGLSAGWRVFSRYHRLEEGDALVLEVLKETEIRVHIFRVADYIDNLDDIYQNQKRNQKLLEMGRKHLSIRSNPRKTPRGASMCNGTIKSERSSLQTKVKDAHRLSQESCIMQSSENQYQAPEEIVHHKHEEAISMLAKEIKHSDLEGRITVQVCPDNAIRADSQGQSNNSMQLESLNVDQLINLAQCPASSLLLHVLHNGW
ncbi:hypothetical protein O6H91_18G049500 [Diphasiastrum complanatum]|uniref:Uncharacterized protein n=1 Tax=Diphasiastrum complanatum TaxID=34168 RepID=A0ACC2B0U0_DIPCM|nr:hypothetical protein O6H91_18G049500 [Diphasiastrum complanatum]